VCIVAGVQVGGVPNLPDPVSSCLHPACRGLAACAQRSHGPVATAYFDYLGIGDDLRNIFSHALHDADVLQHGVVSDDPVLPSDGLVERWAPLLPMNLTDASALLYPSGDGLHVLPFLYFHGCIFSRCNPFETTWLSHLQVHTAMCLEVPRCVLPADWWNTQHPSSH
jgi:hypothetical protein